VLSRASLPQDPTEAALLAIQDALLPNDAKAPKPDPADRPIRFSFNEAKTLEAVVLIAHRWPGVTPFYVAKVLFFADRDHLRTFGRPVTGDRYIAMASGPVPSRVYDMVKGNLDFFGNPSAIVEAIRVDRNDRWARIYSSRSPNLDLLSETDIEALTKSVDFCRARSFNELSELTHQEPAWAHAPANGEMNPELLVAEDMREEVREAAAYAAL
jgi:uncharacterized phage-associated protein